MFRSLLHRHARLLLAAVISLHTAASAQVSLAAPPKHEIRGVWVTTTSGLDWPRTLDRYEQQTSLRAIVQNLHRANFNTIFFQVRARGDAYYRSSFEPWAENLTGTLGRDPGWDPLAFLLAEAHAVGMEVHAWFNVYKVRGMGVPPPTTPPHVSRANPQWTVENAGEVWLDPGIPEVRKYLLAVAIDLVQKYDIDGINFDFMRYPGREFADADTYRRYGNGTERDDWRRGNINGFISEFYRAATALKPMVKIGSSPLGVYDYDNGAGTRGGYSSTFQDSQGWLRRGDQDYLSPQIYWDVGTSRGDPDFALLVRRWQEQSAGRQICAGIAAYKPEVLRQIGLQIDLSRAAGNAGQVFFRYENIRALDMFGDRYRTPALIPPMGWKDSIPPLPPANLAVSEIVTNVFNLEWTPPAAAGDGDKARAYAIYRASRTAPQTDDVRNLVAIVPARSTVYVDTVKVPSGLTYYYAVTAIDKGNNESVPSTVGTGTFKELLALKGKLSNITTLSTSFGQGGRSPNLVAYRLAHRTLVFVEVSKELANGKADSLTTTLVSAVQDEGTYIVGLNGIRFTPGKYVVRLRTGATTLEQPLDFRR